MFKTNNICGNKKKERIKNLCGDAWNPHTKVERVGQDICNRDQKN